MPTNTIQSTPNINLATFIKEVKDVASSGHYFKGNQLWISFKITREEMQQYETEYINSIYSRYDATRQNFLHLLK